MTCDNFLSKGFADVGTYQTGTNEECVWLPVLQYSTHRFPSLLRIDHSHFLQKTHTKILIYACVYVYIQSHE